MSTADCDDLSSRGRTTSTVAAAAGRRESTRAVRTPPIRITTKTTRVTLRRAVGCTRLDLSIFSLFSSLERFSIQNQKNFLQYLGFQHGPIKVVHRIQPRIARMTRTA